MPTTAKVKVMVEGAEKEGELDLATLPEAAVAEAFKDKFVRSATFEDQLSRRAISIAKGQGYLKPEEIEANPELIARIVEKHAPKPVAGSNAEEQAAKLAERLKQEQAGWEERVLKPKVTELTTSLEEYKAQNGKLVTRGMQKEIVAAAAAAGVKAALLKAPNSQAVAPIVALTGDRYAYDPKTDNYYVKDGEGFKFSSTGAAPYMTIQEDLEAWAANKDNAEFIVTGRQNGPGLAAGGKGGQASDGNVYLTPEQYSDPREYEKALAKVGNDYSRVQLATK